jgi:D-alanyl-D-alanine endopeptidase (penicillin-binding protein 7)
VTYSVHYPELLMPKSVFIFLLMCSFFLSTGTAANAADKPDSSTTAKKQTHKSTAKKSTRRRAAAAPSKAKRSTSKRTAAVVLPAVVSAGDLAGLNRTPDALDLKSNVALVMDQSNSKVLFEKNSNVALPIASITKLMTSMVVVESNQNMDEMIEVTSDDIDREKNSSSRLRVGSILSRANMLHIALMSSENRAASALGRNYPGGLQAFVLAMNAKAKSLGMNDTHYVDSTGLSSHNVATAQDLAKLVIAARQHQIIGQYSTDTKYVVKPGGGALQYSNSNHLVGNPGWDIDLQKTGYINEAGRCLVMVTNIEGRPIVMVFLDSKGKRSRTADAGRIRKWIETLKPENLTNPLAAPTARSLPVVHS